MRLPVFVLTVLLLCVGGDAQGNKEQFLENQYNTGKAHSQAMDRSPTRPPSVKARLETTIPTAVPTPKPPTKAMNKPPTQAAAAASNLPTPRPSRAQPIKKPPTKLPSSLPTATSLTVSPTTASPSETPSTSPAPSALPTLSASPTQEPTVSASQSPSNSPSVSPSVAPTSQPSAGPSSNPTHQPSSQPSLSQSPSAAPTNSAMPSALPSSSPTISPSDFPSVAPSSTPSAEPSSIPSASPSLQPSSQPSLSAVPSTSPTNSAMPSARPSVVPSSAPSSQPSEEPSAEPSLSPSGVPSASPSSVPSQVPSDLPTAQPSAVPTLSVQPSAVPSQSMLPTEDGFEEIEAEIAVPVRSSSLMDKPTVAVFETTTMNFLNDHLPSNDSITVTSVKATDQTLETRRKLAERDLQVTDLKVDILVKATWFVGNATDAYPLEQNVEKTFQKHYKTYASMLVDASSFFRIGFQAGRSDGEAESPASGSPLTGSTLIIVCAVAGCALFALFSAFFVWRIHASRGNASSGPSMGLPSWSSQEISASSGFVSNGSIESPTESEIYTRQHSRRSIFSERSSPNSSQRSGLSERSDSPTVGSPYNIDDKSIDTNITNSDRYLQNPNPYSPFSSLAPVDENSQMTDVDLTTPRNGRTPRGSEFFEVQRFSAAPVGASTGSGEHVTPKHAKFEDCDVRSPKVAFVNQANTPKGTDFVQLNTTSAEKTGSIIDDLTRFERAWDSELDSKVNAVTETPKANNLERYKKAPRSVLYGADRDIYYQR